MTEVKITESELNNIIKESVKKIISRDLISPITEESEFLNNPPFIIEEELITTYPIDKSISAFAKVYNLQIVSNRKEAYSLVMKANSKGDTDFNGVIYKESSVNNTERIIMLIGDSEYNKSIAEHYMDKYGYILSNIQKYIEGWKIFTFEKKFDNEATEIVKNVGYLYHICKMSIKEKILKKGLTPRGSQWKTFNNGPRCYFFLPIDKEQIDKWVMNFRLKKGHINEKYMLLKINVNKLPLDIKFYN